MKIKNVSKEDISLVIIKTKIVSSLHTQYFI